MPISLKSKKDLNKPHSKYRSDRGDFADSYEQVLFKPGQALQARELNAVQTILQRYIKNLSDAQGFKNGVIGDDHIHINEVNNTIIIDECFVYNDGVVLKFKKRVFNIENLNDVGKKLKARIKYEVHTVEDDSDLYDPTIQVKLSEKLPGADRLRVVLYGVMTYEDDEGIHEIVIDEDGNIVEDGSDSESYSGSSSLGGGTDIEIGEITPEGEIINSGDNSLIELLTKEFDNEIIRGLQVHSNPMRFAGLEKNNKEYSGVEIEPGSYKINDTKYLSSESKTFLFEKTDVNDSKRLKSKQQLFKLGDMADLLGTLWGDIPVNLTDADEIERNNILNEMSMPGQTVQILLELPVVTDDKEIKYVKIPLCEADILDVYNFKFANVKQDTMKFQDLIKL